MLNVIDNIDSKVYNKKFGRIACLGMYAPAPSKLDFADHTYSTVREAVHTYSSIKEKV